MSAVDELGRELGSVTVRNDRTGHRQLRRRAAQRGPDRRFGIEGSGSFGAALAQDLVAAGEIVFEVPATLTDRERRHLHEPGKSDPGDALAIARVLVREQSLRRVSRPSLADDLELLVIARDELVSERTRVANRLHADLLVLATGYGALIPNLVAARHLATVARMLGRHASTRAELARSRLGRLRSIDREVAGLEARLGALVAASGPSLPFLPGVGVIVAAKLLGESGDICQVRSPAAFAALAGASPIQASSGQTQRHRLNRGGNRQLNRALHLMALVQARTHPPARSYMERRRAEGKTWREGIRCLKRHLSDVVYRTMLHDLQASETHA